jgi:hypothetical protein
MLQTFHSVSFVFVLFLLFLCFFRLNRSIPSIARATSSAWRAAYGYCPSRPVRFVANAATIVGCGCGVAEGKCCKQLLEEMPLARVGEVAPEFSGTALESNGEFKDISLQQYRGKVCLVFRYSFFG